MIFVSRFVRGVSFGLCSLQSCGWVIRGPGLRGEVGTDVVAAERIRGRPRGCSASLWWMWSHVPPVWMPLSFPTVSEVAGGKCY